jgi:hypothetical protein
MTDLPDPESIVTVRRAPTVTSTIITLLAGLLVCVAALPRIGLAPTVIGLVVLATGLFTGRRSLVTLGATGQLVGLFITGASNVPTVRVLVGIAAAVVAWDVGQYAVGLGDQIGRTAPTRRAELRHAGTSLTIAAGTAGIAYTLFLGAAGNQPTTALVALLSTAILLVLVLRKQ